MRRHAPRGGGAAGGHGARQPRHASTVPGPAPCRRGALPSSDEEWATIHVDCSTLKSCTGWLRRVQRGAHSPVLVDTGSSPMPLLSNPKIAPCELLAARPCPQPKLPRRVRRLQAQPPRSLQLTGDKAPPATQASHKNWTQTERRMVRWVTGTEPSARHATVGGRDGEEQFFSARGGASGPQTTAVDRAGSCCQGADPRHTVASAGIAGLLAPPPSALASRK